MSPETITSYSAVVQALAAVVSAGLAGVLVWVTRRYTTITGKILEESRKARSANESSASAALASVHLMRQQLEDEAGLGRSIVQTTIDSATNAVAYWKEQKISSLSPYRLPPTDSLVPSDADAAVNHARRISLSIASKLSSAFDDLRNARNEIEGMRHGVKLTGTVTGMYDSNCSRAEQLFDSAWTKLLEAKAALFP